MDLTTFGSALGNGPLTLDNATILGINGGGLGNSGVTLVGANTIQINGTTATANAFNIPNISGAGTLTITSTVADKWFTMNGTAATGTVNLTGVDTLAFNHVRLNANSSFAILNVNDTRISGRSGTGNSTSIVAIGELHSDTNTRLNAFEGGSPAVHAVWQVGSLNTASDFNGPIQDGAGSGGTLSVSHVKKVGSGTLTLSGTNTYTGNTVVLAGTLSITNPTPALANTADVIMNSGATFNLGFSGTDDIRSLYLDGVSQAAGTWGPIGSGATNERAFFTGTGLLNVLTPVVNGLLGDYNGNLSVDTGDYVVWRDNNGTANVLPNNPFVGLIGQIQYDTWRENFGRSLAPDRGPLSATQPCPSRPVCCWRRSRWRWPCSDRFVAASPRHSGRQSDQRDY